MTTLQIALATSRASAATIARARSSPRAAASKTRRAETGPRMPASRAARTIPAAARAELSVTAQTDRGEPPRVINPSAGCRFRFRCPVAIDQCGQVTPELAPLGAADLAGETSREVACHVAQSGVEVEAF